MNNVLENGTEVLIFKNFKAYTSEQDEINFITGIIVSSKESEDLSYHGSPYYEQIYEVLGKDGKRYIGTYNFGVSGSYVFRTREDHIKRLKALIDINNKEILKIKSKSLEYENQINLLNNNHIKSTNKIKILK